MKLTIWREGVFLTASVTEGLYSREGGAHESASGGKWEGPAGSRFQVGGTADTTGRGQISQLSVPAAQHTSDTVELLWLRQKIY